MTDDHAPELPGLTILGGAAAGLTYEGALHDAEARHEAAAWKRRGGPARRPQPQQHQRPAVPWKRDPAPGPQ